MSYLLVLYRCKSAIKRLGSLVIFRSQGGGGVGAYMREKEIEGEIGVEGGGALKEIFSTKLYLVFPKVYHTTNDFITEV